MQATIRLSIPVYWRILGSREFGVRGLNVEGWYIGNFLSRLEFFVGLVVSELRVWGLIDWGLRGRRQKSSQQGKHSRN